MARPCVDSPPADAFDLSGRHRSGNRRAPNPCLTQISRPKNLAIPGKLEEAVGFGLRTRH